MFIHCITITSNVFNPNCGGLHKDCLDWIKNKKTTVNPINKNNKKRFQYAATFALNHKEYKKHSERITNMKRFIDKYNWEGINYPSDKNDRKKYEKNILTIALNVLHTKKEKHISWSCFKT